MSCRYCRQDTDPAGQAFVDWHNAHHLPETLGIGMMQVLFRAAWQAALLWIANDIVRTTSADTHLHRDEVVESIRHFAREAG